MPVNAISRGAGAVGVVGCGWEGRCGRSGPGAATVILPVGVASNGRGLRAVRGQRRSSRWLTGAGFKANASSADTQCLQGGLALVGNLQALFHPRCEGISQCPEQMFGRPLSFIQMLGQLRE